MIPKELYQRKHRSRWNSSNKVWQDCKTSNLKSINEDYLGDVDLRTLLTTIVENLHAVSHFKNETFTALQYGRDFGIIAKESLKRTTKWSAKYFTHDKSFYPVPTSSMELADVEVMTPPTAARIDPSIEVAMKELVDKYRPVRQRTVRSGTTKDKAGALPPAVYYTQPAHSKVMFHDDSTVEGRERMEQIMPQVTDDDGDSHALSITFVDDSNGSPTATELLLVKCQIKRMNTTTTQAAIWMMTITTPTPTQQHSPGLVAPFALIFALTCRVLHD